MTKTCMRYSTIIKRFSPGLSFICHSTLFVMLNTPISTNLLYMPSSNTLMDKFWTSEANISTTNSTTVSGFHLFSESLLMAHDGGGMVWILLLQMFQKGLSFFIHIRGLHGQDLLWAARSAHRVSSWNPCAAGFGLTAATRAVRRDKLLFTGQVLSVFTGSHL